jgi:hypothetical protein
MLTLWLDCYHGMSLIHPDKNEEFPQAVCAEGTTKFMVATLEIVSKISEL